MYSVRGKKKTLTIFFFFFFFFFFCFVVGGVSIIQDKICCQGENLQVV